MRVIEKAEQTISNHCCICGHGLDRNASDIIIDTGFDFELPGHELDGRKYVGQCCLWDIAKAAGLLTATQLQEAKEYLRKYRYNTEEITDRVQELLDDAVNLVARLPAPPNLDHLDAPGHVIVAESNIVAARAEHRDWAATPAPDDDPPF